MGRMDGKVAIITGGARGQGEAEARQFVAEGAKVVIGDILDAEGKTLADELGESAVYVSLDVTDEDAWRAAVAEAVSRFGKLTIAGQQRWDLAPRPSPSSISDVAVFRRVMEVNHDLRLHRHQVLGAGDHRGRRRHDRQHLVGERHSSARPASRATCRASSPCAASPRRQPSSWARSTSASTRCTRARSTPQ